MPQTVPYQTVAGVSIVPKAPFSHLYEHVIKKDPKLYETIKNLAQPADVSSNLTNPLQVLTFGLGDPSTSDTTPWVTVLSNVPTDQTMYFPLILMGNVAAASDTDIELDIQISHDSGVNFISLLNTSFIIPAGQNVPTSQMITFAKGAYLRNLDLVYMQFLSEDFSGQSINVSLMFQ